MREVRKLTTSGHQVSLISTAFSGSPLQDSARLFSRWSQENFFRYMMEHFAIDLLNEYRTEEIPETKRPVVNPKWRELDRQKRSVKSKLTNRQARFAALTLHPESDQAAVAKWQRQKAALVEEIEQLDKEMAEINSQLKTTPSHLAWDKLPESEKFQRLAPSRKQLVDTVKLIAYRAETAMAAIVPNHWPGPTMLGACSAICFALRPTCYPISSRGSCACRSIRCRTRGPTERSRTCWSTSTRPSSPIRAPS